MSSRFLSVRFINLPPFSPFDTDFLNHSLRVCHLYQWYFRGRSVELLDVACIASDKPPCELHRHLIAGYVAKFRRQLWVRNRWRAVLSAVKDIS